MTAGYFALEQISAGTRHDVPFDWGELREIWRNDALAHRLAIEFPTEGFNFRQRNGGHFYRRTIVPLGSLGIDAPATLSDAWRAMCEELASDTFRAAMATFCRTDLTEFPMEAVAFRGGQDAHYLPHVDASLRRGFRLIVYFNAHWQREWGGLLRILDPRNHCEARHVMMPTVGNATVIIRDGHYQDTWHEVTRLSATGGITRNTLNVTYYEPGTTSTAQ
ncbi:MULTISPECIES: 2OG-Fe(II) oxygenase [Xanthomonas translucens group]|uniref:Prolyl 4-hydroxylase alpha subunit Fe(2+) 2OG dioxygenase domain-containing protein n=2 Tax=Xanthomonas translucens group TaxID=3390202 RepID=A0A0K2ZWI2_9XANT|nr:2OG-Fe(II) oxygenase [Xanthomonas translucens]MCC8447774.1 2OG-Fe(II) oxygenase [Xanthomonas translucens pv. translucens]MCS3360910.1 2OG-Fe(II) oxygenase [Xanthomonas translucens pv. translucens]MCS3374752.1 2OG-Fe(II) oxygenase [Xanthomonas translucens pv. translucens]MCT8290511.1 2OG-Fe(II) oxygenase [Xanthomonas translucens pv. translucens]MCT8294201.1 2OG-Fe(II) oxygenase [Xanthomonas translucens pv. translucens]